MVRVTNKKYSYTVLLKNIFQHVLGYYSKHKKLLLCVQLS